MAPLPPLLGSPVAVCRGLLCPTLANEQAGGGSGAAAPESIDGPVTALAPASSIPNCILNSSCKNWRSVELRVAAHASGFWQVLIFRDAEGGCVLPQARLPEEPSAHDVWCKFLVPTKIRKTPRVFVGTGSLACPMS